MIKKALVLLLLTVSLGSAQPARADIEDTVTTAVGIALAAGATYIGSVYYAKCIYETAKIRFSTELNLLNQYAWYCHYQWDTSVLHALMRDIKTEIVRLHNKNRKKWSITVICDLLSGRQAQLVDQCFKHFPLVQHKSDLDWYIWHLKCIRLLHLHDNVKDISLLIEQLEYIKNLLLSDHDFNKEEQLLAQYYALRKCSR